MSEDWNTLPLDQLFDRLMGRSSLDALIEAARREDLDESGDITAQRFIPAETAAVAEFRGRQNGVIAGLPLLPRIAAAYDPALRVELHTADGSTVEPEASLATLSGPLRSMLAAERVMLNFLTHLSGIASLTHRYVQAVAEAGGTGSRQGDALDPSAGRKPGAAIYDTRKTVPGLRSLAKYAVRCGGGFNHRMGLHDAVLVKDNHIAHVPADELPAVLSRAIAEARRSSPPPAFVEIEVDTYDQLRAVLGLDVDVVLLDNMNPSQLAEAVRLRDQIGPSVQLEASGGVDLGTVRAIAEAGVDRIAVGALTHSAPALDIALEVTERSG